MERSISLGPPKGLEGTGQGKKKRTTVDSARVPVRVHRALVAQQDDDRRETADERAPALVREDVREERAAPAQVRAVGRDGRRHGVVAPDADPKDDAPHSEPDE